MSSENITTLFWHPKKQILDYITNKQLETKGEDNIYELYEHTPHLPISTYQTSWNEVTLVDKPYDFFYTYNSLEKIDHLELYIESVFKNIKRGFICTTSPMIEVSKDVQPNPLDAHYTGHVLNRFFIWTDKNDNTLHILPKLNVVEYLRIDDTLNKNIVNQANNYPFYWNNYYEWDIENHLFPKFKFYHAGKDFSIDGNYHSIINEALVKSHDNSTEILSKISNLLNTN